jgi:hypothetical protein
MEGHALSCPKFYGADSAALSNYKFKIARRSGRSTDSALVLLTLQKLRSKL